MKRRAFLAGLAALPFMGWIKPASAPALPIPAIPLASGLPPGTLRLMRGIVVQGPRPAGVSWESPPFNYQWHRYEQWFPGLVDEAYARDELGDRLDALIADGTFQRGAA